MIPEGEAFAARVDVAATFVQSGMPFFPALAAALDDNDWLLVFAAVRNMAREIRDVHDNEAKNLGEEGKLRRLRAASSVSPSQQRAESCLSGCHP